jgi:UDP-N-acetylglucosamine--dolichyl-phosphate N-acetylglucosaminephosphotransferase
LFPKAPDLHKLNKPLVPNGLGIFYVVISVVYLFLLYSLNIVKVTNGVSPPLTLAVCILFGGFMGLMDDWIDLKWRYKAFLPLIASIPLAAFAYHNPLVRTYMAIPLVGTINFGVWYYLVIIPLLVTIVTNTVNQLGGLNGLETVCPAIIMIGLMAMWPSNGVLLYVPLAAWLILAALNFEGKIFVGNTGSFAIGMTLASFGIISDLKLDMIVCVLPYIFNSALILLTFFIFRAKAAVSFDGKKLSSNHRRSLITLLTYHRSLTERQVVLLISLIVAASTSVALFLRLAMMK